VRFAVFAKGGDEVAIGLNGATNGGVDLRLIEIREVFPEVGSNVDGLDGENDDVGVEAIELAVGIEDFLGVGVEVADLDFGVDAGNQGTGAKQWGEGFDSKGAEEKNARLNERK